MDIPGTDPDSCPENGRIAIASRALRDEWDKHSQHLGARPARDPISASYLETLGQLTEVRDEWVHWAERTGVYAGYIDVEASISEDQQTYHQNVEVMKACVVCFFKIYDNRYTTDPSPSERGWSNIFEIVERLRRNMNNLQNAFQTGRYNIWEG
ncbi:hypothetical protein BDV25DRAFT_140763 [Aspergillus avenaceus]|uniref:Uncharacterized protein n=1 Tax=Aspergillus avenaceus TaxID=36643 RepID=A0A5N6TT86_ASPAV|nr:hypothetical protein BDV25DRAFT_140763 [Aspergillus avenaceus]